MLIFILFYGIISMSNSSHFGFCKEIELETFCFHLVSRTQDASMKPELCDNILGSWSINTLLVLGRSFREVK